MKKTVAKLIVIVDDEMKEKSSSELATNGDGNFVLTLNPEESELKVFSHLQKLSPAQKMKNVVAHELGAAIQRTVQNSGRETDGSRTDSSEVRVD